MGTATSGCMLPIHAKEYGERLVTSKRARAQRRSRTFAPLQKTIQRATVLVHAQRHCGAPAMLLLNETECWERGKDLVSIYQSTLPRKLGAPTSSAFSNCAASPLHRWNRFSDVKLHKTELAERTLGITPSISGASS